MVFSSHIFLFYFLPIALGIYYASPRFARHVLLTLLSYVFYGWANPAFMLLMMGSTAIDYLCGLFISKQWGADWSQEPRALEKGGARSRTQRIALAVSICSNLSLLGFFKYFNFATESYDGLMAAMGLQSMMLETALVVTLPLGISFYTFQSMSYSIDIYRGNAVAIRRPVDFACYVALFPQLVAGPIVRFSELDDQLRIRKETLTKFARGIAFFSLGLSKKILLANPCGKVADTVFNAGSADLLDSWLGMIGYSFQIYFDFSAYSDMAIGLGLMLGFVFPKNFDSPYHAASITEFWRRWHLSLSFFLRDYLYIPLGGNRKGEFRTYLNLATVMLLGGLWHGAGWPFVIWGAIHGGMLAFERAMGKDSLYRRLPHPLKVVLTFLIVCLAWVFFRSPDLESAIRYCGQLVGLGEPQASSVLLSGILYQPYYLLTLGLAAVVAWGFPQSWDFTRRISWPKVAWICGCFWLSILVLSTQEFNPFIYFIF